MKRGYSVVWEDERAFLAVAAGIPVPALPDAMLAVPSCFPGAR